MLSSSGLCKLSKNKGTLDLQRTSQIWDIPTLIFEVFGENKKFISSNFYYVHFYPCRCSRRRDMSFLPEMLVPVLVLVVMNPPNMTYMSHNLDICHINYLNSGGVFHRRTYWVVLVGSIRYQIIFLYCFKSFYIYSF